MIPIEENNEDKLLASLISDMNEERLEAYEKAKERRNNALDAVMKARRPLELAQRVCNDAVREYNRALKAVICINNSIPAERFVEEPIPYEVSAGYVAGFCSTVEPLKKV